VTTDNKESLDIPKPQPESFNPKYVVIRSEGWSLMVGSSASYDKALITLTTAFLGFIFAVINLTPIAMHCMSIFIFILVCLLISIFCSLMSFWFDQIYGDSIINYAQYFYVDKLDEYQMKKHWSYYASMISKLFSGGLFFLALVLFSILFISNLENRNPVSNNPVQMVAPPVSNETNIKK
jgi:hypothetical protein